MRGRLRHWLALSWPDRGRILLMMLVGLPVIAVSVRLLGYVRTRRWLESCSSSGTTRVATLPELDAAGDLARLAAIAGRRVPVNASCLRQSLLVYWVVRRRGLAPELKIGVMRHCGKLDAHAWVGQEGRALDSTAVAHLPFPPH